MKNSIQIFKTSFDDIEAQKNNIYATDDALGYIYHIEHVLYTIADDLVALETGISGLVPGNLTLEKIWDNIDVIIKFLEKCNKNSIEKADKIIDFKDILIKFSHIKDLMLSNNEKFRNDALQLFIRIGNCYSTQEIHEFIDLLNEDELQYIMQIVKQEETLIEKPITKSPIYALASSKINMIKKISKSLNKPSFYDEER